MRVTKINSSTLKTYRLTIEDGEVRDQPYTRTGRRYRVEQITVIKQDGNVRRVELHGSVLKKDGTDSMNGATESFFGQRTWPEWLNGIVGGLA